MLDIKVGDLLRSTRNTLNHIVKVIAIREDVDQIDFHNLNTLDRHTGSISTLLDQINEGRYVLEPAVSQISIEQNNLSGTIAINNHTCHVCKNDKCNTDEKNCWRCGSKL